MVCLDLHEDAVKPDRELVSVKILSLTLCDAREVLVYPGFWYTDTNGVP